MACRILRLMPKVSTMSPNMCPLCLRSIQLGEREGPIAQRWEGERLHPLKPGRRLEALRHSLTAHPNRVWIKQEDRDFPVGGETSHPPTAFGGGPLPLSLREGFRAPEPRPKKSPARKPGSSLGRKRPGRAEAARPPHRLLIGCGAKRIKQNLRHRPRDRRDALSQCYR